MFRVTQFEVALFNVALFQYCTTHIEYISSYNI